MATQTVVTQPGYRTGRGAAQIGLLLLSFVFFVFDAALAGHMIHGSNLNWLLPGAAASFVLAFLLGTF